MKAVYRNPRHAFLFEASVGIITLIAAWVLGRAGIVFVAFLSLRPFMLKRTHPGSDREIWRMYSDIFRISVWITGLSILMTLVAVESGLLTLPWRDMLIVSVIPWYMITHGIVGYFLARERMRDD